MVNVFVSMYIHKNIYTHTLTNVSTVNFNHFNIQSSEIKTFLCYINLNHQLSTNVISLSVFTVALIFRIVKYNNLN